MSEGFEKQVIDERVFNNLVELWYNSHGVSLKTLVDTKNRLLAMSQYFPKKQASKLQANDFVNYRTMRLDKGIDTPVGQCAHILRHTYAGHFLMNGGDILTLQKILGHSSLLVTTRYAHLAPDFLQDAIKYNPLEFNKR